MPLATQHSQYTTLFLEKLSRAEQLVRGIFVIVDVLHHVKIKFPDNNKYLGN